MVVTVGMTIVYFETLREKIVVADLFYGGRTFRCGSIVELIHSFEKDVIQYTVLT